MLHSGDFVKQFTLTRLPEAVPDGWSLVSQRGWYLATHPKTGLPVNELSDSTGTLIGWLIGHAFDSDGLIQGRVKVPAHLASHEFSRSFEQWMFGLAGRFACAVVAGNTPRFYADAAASLAAVYAREQPIVASTIGLVPGAARPSELVPVIDIPRKDSWYPFGLTPRSDVERIVANHYLDLDVWRPIRCWPDASLPTESETAPIVERIAARVERTVDAAAAAGPLSMNLTAGRDSRLILACARRHVGQIQFATTRLPDRTALIDCQIATVLARRHGLQHEVRALVSATEDELRVWLERTGHCVAGRTWRSAGISRPSRSSDRMNISGLCGEVGRAFFWRPNDHGGATLSAETLLSRMGFPAHPLLVERCEAWLREVTVRDAFALLDLLYLEQRVSCWAGPAAYGHVGSRCTVLPLNHRRIFEAMLCLPPEYRREDGLAEDVIRARWPELLRVPFNRYVGARAIVDDVRTASRRMYAKLGTLTRRGRSALVRRGAGSQ
jgi:hypothetical protein